MSMSSQERSSVHRPLAAAAIAFLLAVGCTFEGDHQVPPSTDPPISINAVPEPIEPCGSVVRLEVPGTSNIFGAGIAEPPAPAGGGGGSQPPCLSIPRGASTIDFDATGRVYFETLRFDNPSQFHRCAQGHEVTAPVWGPDGPSVGGCTTNPGGMSISAAGVISGISSHHGVGYLVGVFLPDALPEGPPPESLDFGPDYDFTALCPEMRQTFFIGDGHTSDGTVQRFGVPKEATRMYLGFTDAWGFRHDPGYYGDNSGSLDVTMRAPELAARQAQARRQSSSLRCQPLLIRRQRSTSRSMGVMASHSGTGGPCPRSLLISPIEYMGSLP
jgi:hypothetical protein